MSDKNQSRKRKSILTLALGKDLVHLQINLK